MKKDNQKTEKSSLIKPKKEKEKTVRTRKPKIKEPVKAVETNPPVGGEPVGELPIEKLSINKEEKESQKPGRFFEGIGKRKTAKARVRLFTQGEKEILINEKPLKSYFSTLELQQIAESALMKMKCLDKFRVLVTIHGGGIHAQAEAVRHGTARALVKFNSDFRKRLRRVGYMTRDSRQRERKKFGLKRARRAPQWSKR